MSTKNSSGIAILIYPLDRRRIKKDLKEKISKKLYKKSSYSSDKNSGEKALTDPASMPSSIYRNRKGRLL